MRRVQEQLNAHQPADRRERAARAQALSDLDDLEHPLDRGSLPRHVTASAIVVGRRGVLLHRHRRLGTWMQPGGHLDTGEEPPDAARRECLEETGLAAVHPGGVPRLVHIDVHPAANGHEHIDLRYLMIGPDAPPAPPPGESQEVSWASWDEADALADEALAGGLRTARSLVERGEVIIPARDRP